MDNLNLSELLCAVQALSKLTQIELHGGHGCKYRLGELYPQEVGAINEGFQRSATVIERLHNHIKDLEQQLAHERASNRTMSEYLAYRDGDESASVWIWQGDGEDHPESMVNHLAVLIRANDLRDLIAQSPEDAKPQELSVIGRPKCSRGSTYPCNPACENLCDWHPSDFERNGESHPDAPKKPVKHCWEGGTKEECDCPDCGPCLVQMEG